MLYLKVLIATIPFQARSLNHCNMAIFQGDGVKGVTEIRDGLFGRCTSLTSVTIPSSATELNMGAFSDCTNLKSLIVPDGVTTIYQGRYLPPNLVVTYKGKSYDSAHMHKLYDDANGN